MFDSHSGVLKEIGRETRNNNLNFDKATGEILNKENFTPSKNSELIDQELNNPGEDDLYHQLGFELLPIAVSLPNRDFTKIENIELLDGFKRLFCSTIPDRNIFVKVYDILQPEQWFNAMLLFNSSKLLCNTDLFMDRGFRLGLWKHFDIDTTLYDTFDTFDPMYLIKCYLGFGYSIAPYTTLKDNQYAHLDIKLAMELFELVSRQQIACLKQFFIILRTLRGLELKNRGNAKAFCLQEFVDLFQTPEVKKTPRKNR